MDSESVWDYPRPPRLEACGHRIRVEFNGVVIADSVSALRLLETSHPPTYYIPPQDVKREYLKANPIRSVCEFKGSAAYWDIDVAGKRVASGAWSYPRPSAAYAGLREHFAFYAHLMDGCFVDNERVTPQEGGFYGGWITPNLIGPFKGAPGSRGW